MRAAAHALAALLAGASLQASCGGGHPAIDAATGPDAYVPDDAQPTQDGAPLTWVDFSASGCALATTPGGDAGVDTITCTGPAPLTVAFAPLASGTVDTWAWTFGDGGTSNEATPAHTFAQPGAYDVSLSAAGPGGTATQSRAGYIVVVPADLGGACDDGGQCATGSCACGDASCDAAASMCAAACDQSACAEGWCAALGGPWGADLCVATCTGAGDCPAGRTCQAVAAKGGGWAMGCVPPGVLADLGASCAGAGGFDSAACASGDCLGIGARGACALDCAGQGACPDGTRCATFGNGTAACLPTCTQPADCGTDPWLGCEDPGAGGAWGFTLDAGAAAQVCAPRSCSGAGDCAGGACVDGHCTAI